MAQRGWHPIGPADRQGYPPRWTSLADEDPLRPRAAPFEDDRQSLAGQRVERMSDDDRVRNRTRLGRTGSMPGLLGCPASTSRCPTRDCHPCAFGLGHNRAGLARLWLTRGPARLWLKRWRTIGYARLAPSHGHETRGGPNRAELAASTPRLCLESGRSARLWLRPTLSSRPRELVHTFMR